MTDLRGQAEQFAGDSDCRAKRRGRRRGIPNGYSSEVVAVVVVAVGPVVAGLVVRHLLLAALPAAWPLPVFFRLRGRPP